MEKEIYDLQIKYLVQLENWERLKDDLRTLISSYECLNYSDESVVNAYRFILEKMKSIEVKNIKKKF